MLFVHGKVDCCFNSGGEEHNEPGGKSETGEEREGYEGDSEVSRGVDGGGPERMNKGGKKDAEDGCIHALQGGADLTVGAQGGPEGEHGNDREQAGGRRVR